MKKITKRFISVLLFMCLFTSLLSGLTTESVLAETTSDVSVEESVQASTETSVTWEDVLAGMASPYDFYGELAPETVPEAVGYENATERVHIERMYEEEGDSLYNVIFKNADGTRTVYLFDYPVKYVSDTGEIKDITLDIESNTAQAGSFVSAQNRVQTSLARELSDGITLEDADMEITMVPIAPQSSGSFVTETPTTTTSMTTETIATSATRVDEQTISYYYENKTTIEYSLTYTGFKEDIVVREYTGQTEYDFMLRTNGLILKEINGSYYLTDENGNVNATLGDIIIFTADEKNNTFGSMTYETIRESQEYKLTIHVDAEYLQDEATAYPIRIDPTIEIYYTKDGEGAIADTTVYQYGSANGSETTLHVGKVESKGAARVLMGFPELDLNSITSAECVTNASIEIRDLGCESAPMDISCYIYNGGTWSELSASWSAVQMCDFSVLLSSQAVAYPYGIRQSVEHRYGFDITEAVKGWISGDYSQDKGIIFKTDIAVENGSVTSVSNKTFASYNAASYKPTLRITYDNSLAGTQVVSDGVYYLNNMYSGGYLMGSSEEVAVKSRKVSEMTDLYRWSIQKVDGGYVIRRVMNATEYLAAPTAASSSAAEIVQVTTTEIPKRCIWNISISSVGGCLIKNTYSSKYLYAAELDEYTSDAVLGLADSSTYQERVWRIASLSEVENKELTADASINTLVLSVGATGTPNIVKSPANAMWASVSDFKFSLTTTNYVTFSQGIFRAYATGVTTVVATHKVTDYEFVFAVIVGSVPKFTVNQYVDQGYRLKFDEDEISDYTDFVADWFEMLFGLDVSSSIVNYTSMADTCKINRYGSVTLSNLTEACTHSTDHLTSSALRSVLGNGDNVTAKLLWTGHTLTGNPTSNSNDDTHSVIMTPHYLTHADKGYEKRTDEEIRENNLYGLMHELSHQLGAPDHYCKADNGEGKKCSNPECDKCVYGQDEIRKCIMGIPDDYIGYEVDFETLSEEKLYCDSCLETINIHLSSHHQP